MNELSTLNASLSPSIPCRFYAQGSCNKGQSCHFLHTNPTTSPTNSLPPCRYFSSPQGCQRLPCPYPHLSLYDQTQTQTKNRVEIIHVDPEVCDCASAEFKLHNSKQKQKLSKTIICTISASLGRSILPSLDPQLDTNKFWVLKNKTTGVTFSLHPSNGFTLQGDQNHSLCILSWLEQKLQHFSVCQKKDKKTDPYFRYTCSATSRKKSALPKPLLQRLFEVQQQRKNILVAKKIKTPQTSPTPNTHFSTLDEDEKIIIRKYAKMMSLVSLPVSQSRRKKMEVKGEEFILGEGEAYNLSGSIFDDCEEIINQCYEKKGYEVQHGATFLEEFLYWLRTPVLGPPLFLCHLFTSEGGWHALSPGEEANKMLSESTAGCGRSCQLSELVSFDVLQSFVPDISLYLTEMEIEYWRLNSPKLDYLCLFRDHVLGVSVTRAWNGPFAPFTSIHARRLLVKKLKGLELARKYVEHFHVWQYQLLHVWCPTESAALLLSREFKEICSWMVFSVPTLLFLSSTSFDIPAADSFLFRCD